MCYRRALIALPSLFRLLLLLAVLSWLPWLRATGETHKPSRTKQAAARSATASPLKKMTWSPKATTGQSTSNASNKSNIQQAAHQTSTGSQADSNRGTRTASLADTDIAPAQHEAILADPTMTMVPQPSIHCDDGPVSMGCQSPRCNESCCRGGGYWVRADYLAWSLGDMDLPPLVTTSAGTTPANTGILGRAATTILFGDDTYNDELQSGARVSLGWWADAQQCSGYEVGYLFVGPSGDDFSVNSNDVARIARPVFDTALNAESAMLVAHPDFLTGSLSVETETQLQSIDVLRRQRLRANAYERVDFLIGFKHGRLEDLVRIDQSSRYTVAQGQIAAGTTRSLFDRFETDNQFNGLQLGLNWQQRRSCFTLNGLAKLSLGINQAEVTIDGQTTNTVPGGGTGNFVGGLLAQSTNIGNYDETDFILLPELGIQCGLQLSPRAQLMIGYNAMYWSKLARAADHIDRSVSQFPPEQPSGARRPAFNFVSDELFIHGLNAGLTYRF